MRSRVRDRRVTSFRETLFNFSGNIAGQTREYKIAIERWRWALHDNLFHAFGHVARQSPSTSFRITFLLRTIRGCERGDFKLRMTFQQLNEALTDNTSRAENAYAKFLVHYFV